MPGIRFIDTLFQDLRLALRILLESKASHVFGGRNVVHQSLTKKLLVSILQFPAGPDLTYLPL
jgi:hypothetical protein